MDVQDIPETESTRLFIRHAGKFFDCLNVSRTYSGHSKRKDALMPYFTKDDWQFDVGITSFLWLHGLSREQERKCGITKKGELSSVKGHNYHFSP